MGAPVVTLTGDRHAARVGASLLERLDLHHLVARTNEEFIHHCLGLARDPAALARLRASLRERMRASPLMDSAGFTHAVEEAFERMVSVNLMGSSSGVAGSKSVRASAQPEAAARARAANGNADDVDGHADAADDEGWLF